MQVMPSPQQYPSLPPSSAPSSMVSAGVVRTAPLADLPPDPAVGGSSAGLAGAAGAVATAPHTAAILVGTLPVLPFADRFYGTIQADGQRPRIAAVACTSAGAVAVLSLVGYDTSVAAALARLYQKETLFLDLDEEVEWSGPKTLSRPESGLRQAAAALLGTRERHYVAFARTADIGEGLLHPPAIPPELDQNAQQEEESEPGEGDTSPVASSAHAGHHQPPPQDATPPAPRVVLGNWNESAPARSAVLGHLRALRIIHLPHWADALWEHGLQSELIVELPALGIRAWQLTDDLARWSALVSDGVRRGWLTDVNGAHWAPPASAMLAPSQPAQQAPTTSLDPAQEDQPAA